MILPSFIPSDQIQSPLYFQVYINFILMDDLYNKKFLFSFVSIIVILSWQTLENLHYSIASVRPELPFSPEHIYNIICFVMGFYAGLAHNNAFMNTHVPSGLSSNTLLHWCIILFQNDYRILQVEHSLFSFTPFLCDCQLTNYLNMPQDKMCNECKNSYSP